MTKWQERGRERKARNGEERKGGRHFFREAGREGGKERTKGQRKRLRRKEKERGEIKASVIEERKTKGGKKREKRI